MRGGSSYANLILANYCDGLFWEEHDHTGKSKEVTFGHDEVHFANGHTCPESWGQKNITNLYKWHTLLSGLVITDIATTNSV